MSNKYDSILKEKKKYDEVVDNRHFLRRHALIIDFLVIIVILIISFIIYFLTILNPARVIYDDILDFVNYIDIVYERGLIIYDFNSKYNFNGNVDVKLDTNYDNKEVVEFLNGLSFNYSYMENSDNRLFNVSGDNYSFDYFEDNKNGYLNYEDRSVNYNLLGSNYGIDDYEDILGIVSLSLKEELKELDIDKNVFISNGRLVISIDFELSGIEINNIYRNVINKLESRGRVLPSVIRDRKLVSDSATYRFTIKNGIFENNLIDLKIVSIEEDNRAVFTYYDDTFKYKDNNNEYKCVLKVEDIDFSLRLYEDDVMKYILSGSGNDNSYSYTYQVINVIDNLSLKIVEDTNENKYNLIVKKEKDDNYFNLYIDFNVKYNNYADIDNTSVIDKDYVLYDELDEKDKKQIDNYVYRIYNSFKDLYNYVK